MRVLVAGAGVTGRSAVPALLDRGDQVTVTDSDAGRLTEFADMGADTAVGLAAPPSGTELVVTSPGWRPDAPLLVAAADAGIDVIGDVELAWRIGQARPRPPTWLAVTGTNGKTTTVGMLESILRASGANAVACGNVGYAVLDAVREGFDVLAVELSSFQLHWSSTLAPAASAVLNVAEDHIDWHGSLHEYAAAKGKIYTHAHAAVFNAQDPTTAELAKGHPDAVGFTLDAPEPGEYGVVDGRLIDGTGAEICRVDDVSPPGPHNVANALAAAALARAGGVTNDAIRAGLKAFTPGAHRAEPVADVDGVHYVDDSKATNPHAAAGSLMTHEHVVWIAGGQLKGARIDELVLQVADRLRGVVLLGQDADVIAAAVARHAPDVPVIRADSGEHKDHARGIGASDLRAVLGAEDIMTAAVQAAHALAHPGDAVVLAPAAASLDMFSGYAHRGAAFADAVHALTVGEAHGNG